MLVTLVLITAIFLTACVSKESQNVAKVFTALKVPYAGVTAGGDTLEVIYEASSADEYDTQIIADWAAIFGAGSNFPYEEIIIVNTVNGEPVARLTTTSANVKAYLDYEKNETEFWSDVEIDAID